MVALTDEHLEGYVRFPEAMTMDTLVDVVRELKALRRKFAAAEKVAEAARYYKDCHKTLHIALEAYDKLVKGENTEDKI